MLISELTQWDKISLNILGRVRWMTALPLVKDMVFKPSRNLFCSLSFRWLSWADIYEPYDDGIFSTPDRHTLQKLSDAELVKYPQTMQKNTKQLYVIQNIIFRFCVREFLKWWELKPQVSQTRPVHNFNFKHHYLLQQLPFFSYPFFHLLILNKNRKNCLLDFGLLTFFYH